MKMVLEAVHPAWEQMHQINVISMHYVGLIFEYKNVAKTIWVLLITICLELHMYVIFSSMYVIFSLTLENSSQENFNLACRYIIKQ